MKSGLIVDNWFLDPLRKEGLGSLIFGPLIEKFSTLADSIGLVPFVLPWVMTGRLRLPCT
jgi:hypothetical protein